MSTNILINDGEKYSGQYVATKTFIDKEIIAHGDDLVKVTNEAKKQGIETPVVFYVPKENIAQIY